MARRWTRALTTACVVGVAGCVQPSMRGGAPGLVMDWRPAAEVAPPLPEPDAASPVETYVRLALAENRTVRAAYHNVQSLRHRVPQVTALDDPVASNAVFPIPSVGPQYALMGYNPYNLTLAQQFPWFGTLRLRGEVADRDVQVALAELSAAQLNTINEVKRAYYTLYAAQRAGEILDENRAILDDFRTIAVSRLAAGGSQQDVIRAGTMLSELDRNLAENRQAIASARSALARQTHSRPDAEFRTEARLTLPTTPDDFEGLDRLACAARPELQGRLAAVARDEKAVELARKRSYPNVTIGITYMDMTKTNAVAPATASGTPNVGLFVGFNLPVNRKKYRAGVCEAQERAFADAMLYEAQKDEASGEVQELIVQVKSQREILTLLQDGILPRAVESFGLARSDYGKGNVDYATAQSALREVLQVRLQLAQAEAELGKSIASLERAVGRELTERPIPPN